MSHPSDNPYTQSAITNSVKVAGSFLLLSAGLWVIAAGSRRKEWVDILLDYCHHKRSCYGSTINNSRVYKTT